MLSISYSSTENKDDILASVKSVAENLTQLTVPSLVALSLYLLFSDSEIAQKMKLRKSKVAYSLLSGISLYLKMNCWTYYQNVST